MTEYPAENGQSNGDTGDEIEISTLPLQSPLAAGDAGNDFPGEVNDEKKNQRCPRPTKIPQSTALETAKLPGKSMPRATVSFSTCEAGVKESVSELSSDDQPLTSSSIRNFFYPSRKKSPPLNPSGLEERVFDNRADQTTIQPQLQSNKNSHNENLRTYLQGPD